MWTADEFICTHCLVDPDLVKFVAKNAVAQQCSFCATTSNLPIAAPIDVVSQHFLSCLYQEYDLAGNQLGWASSEGGWLGEFWDSSDLAYYVLELEFPRGNDSRILWSLFGEQFEQDWCTANAYGLDDSEQPRFSWDHFCDVVKHQRRHFFMDDTGDSLESDVLSAAEILDTILSYAERMNLYESLPEGTRLLRARWESRDCRYETPGEIGPPPVEKANQPNRMSPAGIPMFYGCDDEETALRETASGPGHYAIGTFETMREVTILDLTALPPIPGLFAEIPDSAEVPPRRALRFLHHIASEVSHPIERGDRVHVEYVPTQIVTEFIRTRATSDGSKIDGIRYESSVHAGHVSYVLFADQSNVEGASPDAWNADPWLRLIHVQHRRFSMEQSPS